MEKVTDLEINEKKLEKVTTTLPKEVKAYIRDKGYRVNELIRLGLVSKEDNPQLIDRIRRLETSFSFIEKRLEEILYHLDRLRVDTK